MKNQQCTRSFYITVRSSENTRAFGPRFRGEDGSFASLRSNGSIYITFIRGEYGRAFGPRFRGEDGSIASFSREL
jgi:hypothetical protein